MRPGFGALLVLAAAATAAAAPRARSAERTATIAHGLERRIQELARRQAELPKPTLAELAQAAEVDDYAPNARLKAEIRRKLEERDKAEAPLVLEMTVLARRLEVYRKTGELPDTIADAAKIKKFLDDPWGEKNPDPGASRNCLVLSRCHEALPFQSELPALIKQLDRFHVNDLRPVAAKKSASPARTRVVRVTPPEPKTALEMRAVPVSRPKAPSPSADEVIALLSSPDGRTRALAADMLADMGPPASAAVPVLRRALSDRDPCVRASAARALSSVAPAPTAEIIADLQRALLDPNEDVRLSSRAALGRLASR